MNDSVYMKRCLELAKIGLGSVSPNPMVGCVIVHHGKIIGEGYHKKCGQAHAEVNAIAAVKNKELLKESTLYVSLEPCNHFGKTPPCADLIVKHQIPKVVIGMKDPFPKVSGDGIKHLRENGVEVVVWESSEDFAFLNRRFIMFHAQKRPYIILKWAQTKNGFIAGKNKNERLMITDEHAQRMNHQWRAEEDAILVGCNTVIQDNPELTTRFYPGKNPKKLIIDPSAKISTNARVFQNDDIYWFNLKKTEHSSSIRAGGNMIQSVLDFCYGNEIQSIIVEGGAVTIQQFIQARKFDEVRVLVGAQYIKNGLSAPNVPSGFYRNRQATLPNNQISQTFYYISQ